MASSYHVKQVLGSRLSRTAYRGPDQNRASAVAGKLIDRRKAVRVEKNGVVITDSTGRRSS